MHLSIGGARNPNRADKNAFSPDSKFSFSVPGSLIATIKNLSENYALLEEDSREKLSVIHCIKHLVIRKVQKIHNFVEFSRNRKQKCFVFTALIFLTTKWNGSFKIVGVHLFWKLIRFDFWIKAITAEVKKMFLLFIHTDIQDTSFPKFVLGFFAERAIWSLHSCSTGSSQKRLFRPLPQNVDCPMFR